MRNLSKLYGKSKHIFLFNNFFEHPGVYEIMWKNIVHPESPQMTIYGASVLYDG
jgi:hypothetical protein